MKPDFNLGFIMELAPDLHHGIVFKSTCYENNRYHYDVGWVGYFRFWTGSPSGSQF
jgi:hypothetical protein